MNAPTKHDSFDDLCDRFQLAWKAGEHPVIEEYLEQVADTDRQRVLCELLQIELWWRREETPSFTADEYKDRFADHTDAVEKTLQEFHARTLGRGVVATAAMEDATILPDEATILPDEDATILPDNVGSPLQEDVTIPPDRDAGLSTAISNVGDRVRYFGEYELLDEIARGGMGVVFKARQVKLNRIVALKMILSGQLAGDEEVKRFHTEAEAAASLDHPGIVPIYEIGEHGGQYFFSMGFVDGQCVQDKLRDGPLASREAAELCRKVAEAVNYAHDKGVIHRDLKPANVLLDTNGEPKVTDFGLAKQVESGSDLTRTGAVMGTPSYMPPEQASGKTDEVGPRADVYSLGAILYCLLTGRPPFQAATSLDTMLQVMESAPIAPRVLIPQIPRDLETICLKCLEKEMSRRYQSANELVEELGRFLNGEPVKALPVSKAEHAWRWCKRKRALASAISVLTVLLTTLAIGGPLVAIQQSHLKEQAFLASQKAESAAKDATEQKEIAEQLLNGHRISEAGRHIANRPNRSIRALNGVPPDARGFAWHLLKLRAQPLLQELPGHTAPGITAIAYSPDSKRLFSGGGDHTIRVWDLATRTSIHVNYLPADADAIDVSKDGKMYAGGAQTNIVYVWNCQTGKLIHRLKGHRARICAISFHPNDQVLASASVDGAIRFWDLSDGSLVHTVDSVHTTDLLDMGYAPDGATIYSCGGDRQLCAIDATTGDVIQSQRVSKAICDLAISSRGQVATTGYDWTIRVWDTNDLSLLWQKSLAEEQPLKLSYDATGKTLLSHGCDGTLRFRDGESGRLLRSIAAGPVGPVACSPDGTSVACTGAGTAPGPWEFSTTTQEGDLVVDCREPLNCLAWDPTDKMIIAGGNRGHISIVNAISGELHKNSERLLSGNIVDLAYPPSGNQIYVAGSDGIVRCRHDGTIITREEMKTMQGVTCLDVSPVNHTVVSGDAAGKISLHDATSLAILNQMHDDVYSVTDVSFSPDGDWVASCGVWTLNHHLTGSCFLRRTSNFEEKEIVTGHHNAELSVAFSPDSSVFATTGQDNRILLRRTGQADVLHELAGHKGYVYVSSFSPDGSLLASINYNQDADESHLWLWDVTTGLKLAEVFQTKGRLRNVAWSHDGKKIATSGLDGMIRVWTPLATIEK